MAVLWEVCPLNREGFFMGLFHFLNELCLCVGLILGSLIVICLNISEENVNKVCFLIFTHFLFIVISTILLFLTKIPEKP